MFLSWLKWRIWVNEELADSLVEVTHLRDESVDWAHGGATMAQINSNRYMVLERAMEATIGLVHPMGQTFVSRLLASQPESGR